MVEHTLLVKYMVNGGNVSTTIASDRVIEEYLCSNGYNGNRPEAMVFIGGPSVMSQGLLDCGIGVGLGAGGDYQESGVGGCLYILSSKIYCVCTVQVPAEHSDATVRINVTGDDFTEGINTRAKVGTITGTGTQTFIVKKGSTVEYTVEKEHYIAQGKAENIGTVAATEGEYNSSSNTHTIPVTLKKKILTHTIQTNGANITINGKFTDANGNITNTSMTGTGSITFNVWSAEPTITLISAEKTYYNTLSNVNIELGTTKTQSIKLKDGNAIVETSGTNTTVTLPKNKYYSTTKPSFSLNKLGDRAEWIDTTFLNGDGDSIVRLFRKDEYGQIILTFDGDVNTNGNWKLYIKGYKVGDHANDAEMKVTVKDANGNIITDDEKYTFEKKDTIYDAEIKYSSKNIKTIIIRLVNNKDHRLNGYRFWLSQVYIETDN